MANITNRSPWQVKLPSGVEKFRLRSQAIGHLTSLGYDPEKLPARVLKQLETAFEVQITRKDSKGETVNRRGTFDTRELAEEFGKDQEKELADIVKAQGGFTVGFETITVEEVLYRLLEQHYKKKASYNEISYRIPRLAEWLGAKRKFRQLTRLDMTNLLARLQALKYSDSSISNFFTVLTTLYRFAKKRWHYPVENIASEMDLTKPNNAIQRYWVEDEEERLMKSLELRSPWLIPIVQLSQEMAFRRGELVQAPVRKTKIRGVALEQPSAVVASETTSKRKTKAMTGGLKWEYLDWSIEVLSLPKEKNDHAKKATEFKGRKVPITKKMREILWPLYEASATKKGLVFNATINSVSNSFRIACEKAVPPIEDLTFHSLRKIATRDLSRRVTNPMELGRLSGHKNIEVLNKRYYEVPIEELAALLRKSSGTIHDRGISALTATLGLPNALKFIKGIRALSDPKDAFS